MNFEALQKDMRLAYVGGGSGILASSVIWITSAIISIYFSKQISIIVFFFGGLFIYPMGIMISKFFNRTGKHQKDNPLSKLALESTAILFIGLFLAYSVFQIESEWFFPIMLMIIGVRYLIFQSIYGIKLYWILGLTLIISGMICLISNQVFFLSVLIGGIVEMIFGILIIQNDKKQSSTEKEV